MPGLQDDPDSALRHDIAQCWARLRCLELLCGLCLPDGGSCMTSGTRPRPSVQPQQPGALGNTRGGGGNVSIVRHSVDPWMLMHSSLLDVIRSPGGDNPDPENVYPH